MSEDAIKKLEIRVAALEAVIAAMRGVFSPEEEIDDADLDSPHGNPVIRKDPTPRFWKGPAGFAGKKLSECTPEYLDAFAKYKDTCAKMTEKGGDPSKQKYAGYDRLDAARARGWSRRLRAGWAPSQKPTSGGAGRFAGDGGGNGIGAMNGSGRNPFAGGDAPPPSDRMADDDFDFGANAPDDDEAPL